MREYINKNLLELLSDIDRYNLLDYALKELLQTMVHKLDDYYNNNKALNEREIDFYNNFYTNGLSKGNAFKVLYQKILLEAIKIIVAHSQDRRQKFKLLPGLAKLYIHTVKFPLFSNLRVLQSLRKKPPSATLVNGELFDHTGLDSHTKQLIKHIFSVFNNHEECERLLRPLDKLLGLILCLPQYNLEQSKLGMLGQFRAAEYFEYDGRFWPILKSVPSYLKKKHDILTRLLLYFLKLLGFNQQGMASFVGLVNSNASCQFMQNYNLYTDATVTLATMSHSKEEHLKQWILIVLIMLETGFNYAEIRAFFLKCITLKKPDNERLLWDSFIDIGGDNPNFDCTESLYSWQLRNAHLPFLSGFSFASLCKAAEKLDDYTPEIEPQHRYPTMWLLISLLCDGHFLMHTPFLAKYREKHANHPSQQWIETDNDTFIRVKNYQEVDVSYPLHIPSEYDSLEKLGSPKNIFIGLCLNLLRACFWYVIDGDMSQRRHHGIPEIFWYRQQFALDFPYKIYYDEDCYSSTRELFSFARQIARAFLSPQEINYLPAIQALKQEAYRAVSTVVDKKPSICKDDDCGILGYLYDMSEGLADPHRRNNRTLSGNPLIFACRLSMPHPENLYKEGGARALIEKIIEVAPKFNL